MQTTTLIVEYPEGLNESATRVIAKAAELFNCRILLIKDGAHADAKNAFAMSGLKIGRGDTVTIQADGNDADEAIKTLIGLIMRKFTAPVNNPVANTIVPALS